MGNRAHARIDFPSYGGDEMRHIYLYTHWDGVEALRAAIEEAVGSKPARARIGDGEYFARIVIQRVLNTLAISPDRDTGFGIGVDIPDGDLCAVVNVNTGLIE